MTTTAGAGRAPLRIAVAQPSITPDDRPANVAAHAAVVQENPADVLVFPEMSLTGYYLDAPPVATDDRALAPLVAACARTGATALVGAPVQDAADFIAVLAVDSTGVTVAYRKMWLGVEEAGRFAAGTQPAVVAILAWRLGLAVCKDTGVPEHQRQTVALGVDAYVAGAVMLPAERAEQDRRGSSIARTHGTVVALASFAGPTGAGYDATAGCSAIWSPTGEVLEQAGAATDLVATAVLIRGAAYSE